jgi:hypothetical protein
LFLAIVLSVAIWLATGCGTDGGPEGPDNSDTTAQTSTTPARRPTTTSILDTVSRIRGLPVTAEIPVTYISRDQLRQQLAGQLEQEYPVEELSNDEAVLKLLGLIPPEADLMSEITSLLGGQVIGYYDDETKQLKVVSQTDEITPINEITLSHEFTHALQDQLFDLNKQMDVAAAGNGDGETAVLALIEGDATLVEEEYGRLVMSAADLASALLGSLGGLTQGGSVGGGYLIDSLEFPYLDGSKFVQQLYGVGGWETVNAAYDHPPNSTEQIMHPEKYLADEQPAAITIPDLSGVAGGAWSLSDEDVVGEFDVREIIGENLPASRASLAAAGWGGGRFQYYTRGSQRLLAVSLTWDSEMDATEFATAMGENLERRYATRFDISAAVPLLQSPDGAWALVQHGNLTTLVLAADASAAIAASAAVSGI